MVEESILESKGDSFEWWYHQKVYCKPESVLLHQQVCLPQTNLQIWATSGLARRAQTCIITQAFCRTMSHGALAALKEGLRSAAPPPSGSFTGYPPSQVWTARRSP